MAIKTTTVHIICWDGYEYDRQATEWEIAQMKEDGVVKYHGEQLVFDFRH